MHKNQIALQKLSAVFVIRCEQPSNNRQAALTLNVELMNLGFVMSAELLAVVGTLPEQVLVDFSAELLAILRALKGAHVKHKPMYPDFPQRVMAADEVELYWNALCHYWTSGLWLPAEFALPRTYAFEAVKYQTINLADEAEFTTIFQQLLASPESWSPQDTQIAEWFLLHYPAQQLTWPQEIPFAENRAVVAACLLQQGSNISVQIKTATDILRIVTHLSGGDVSLATNTKFISLLRATRKILVTELARVINEEDIGRHRNKWVRLFHALHVGDYSNKVFAIAKKARNQQGLQSFYSDVEYLLQNNDIAFATEILRTRPGELARKLDQLLRLSVGAQQQQVVDAFLAVVDQMASRTLLQLLGHLQRRHETLHTRVVFPKGSTQKAVLLATTLEALPAELVLQLTTGIEAALTRRFAQLPSLGKVWIAPELQHCPLPSQQRSASAGLFTVARGTRLPIGDDKGTLRCFVYWHGQDIDLSASFHGDDFGYLSHVSYTRLQVGELKAYHSGDITWAPNGASEFIDIDIAAARAKGARYLVMHVMVFNGPSFVKHEVCFAGWMTRSKPNSNEIYDAKTVSQKIDIRSDSHNVIPVIFDLVQRQAIWTDIASASRIGFYANNVENNRATIVQTLQAVVEANHKVSLQQLFALHAQARGQRVSEREQADTVFALDGDVTPYQVNRINAEFVG